MLAALTTQVIAGETIRRDALLGLVPDDDRQSYRGRRFAMLRTLRSASGLRSVRRCMNPIPDRSVTVTVGRPGVAHMGGVGRCGSPWACPVCMAMVRRHRAGEVDRVVDAHLEHVPSTKDAPSGLFVTVTLPHKGEGLGRLLDVLLGEYRAFQQTSRYRRICSDYGVVGVIKAVEMTHGRNGWHPHLHMIWLLDQATSALGMECLRQELSDAWAVRVKQRLGRTLHGTKGIDVRPVYRESDGQGDGLGSYLVESDGGWSAAFEMTRADLKAGKGGGRTPAMILVAAAEYGEAWAWGLWWEYETATKGRRMLTWSRGLRDRYGLNAELTDEEAAASMEAPGGADSLVYEVHGRRWKLILDHGEAGAFLTQVEQAAAIAYALCDFWHRPPD